MKQAWILILTLGLLVGLLSGCTDKGNVSEDKDGMITDAPTVKPTVPPTEGTENTDDRDAGDDTDSSGDDIVDDILGDLTEAPADSARTRRHRSLDR